MKKTSYLAPESTVVLLTMEAMLCQSGSYEEFTPGEDYPMFAPVFDFTSIL